MKHLTTCKPHKRPGRAAKVARQQRAYMRLVEDYANLPSAHPRFEAWRARIARELINLRAKGIEATHV